MWSLGYFVLNIMNNPEPPYFVYALLAEDSLDNGYIKIGRASNLFNRVQTLRTGCPFPIKYIGYINVGSLSRGRAIERTLHRVFSVRRTSGEWFAVDFRDPEDKLLFASACKAVFAQFKSAMPERKWTTLSMEEFTRLGRKEAA